MRGGDGRYVGVRLGICGVECVGFLVGRGRVGRRTCKAERSGVEGSGREYVNLVRCSSLADWM